MIIIPAIPQDSKVISSLCYASKSFWGYNKDELEAWRDQLTLTPSYISKNSVFKLIVDDELIAFYAYYKTDKVSVMLDYFFILPDYIGKGFGKVLMDEFLVRVMSEKTHRIVLHADPHAESFYKKYGFISIGKESTSIDGRFLPIMELQL